MSEFPEDVLFVARSLVWPQYVGNEATVERIIMGECDSWPLVVTAAKAILAERERCAAFMDRRAEEVSAGGGNVSHMMAQIFRAEASSIRDGKDK